MSWGINDTIGYRQSSGYIAINGKVWQASYYPSSYYRIQLGFYTLQLNLDNCTAANIQHFDTSSNATRAVAMATYINGLPPATVLIGVTTYDAANQLTNATRNALNVIGVNVTQLQQFGKVVFVSQVGRPSATLLKLSSPGGSTIRLIATVKCTYMEHH